MSKTKDIIRAVLRWSAYILLSVLLLFTLLVLVIRIPPVQTRIIQKVTQVVSTKTGAEFNIDKLYLTYSGGLKIEGLFLGTSTGDTILQADHLNTGIAVWPIFNSRYQISHLDMEGATINLIRGEDSLFNYDFIISAFTSTDTLTNQTAVNTSYDNPGKAPELSAGLLHLSDCRFHYLDSVSGMQFKTRITELEILPDQIDLNRYRFSVNYITLKGSNSSFLQYKAATSDSDSSSTPLPEVSWQHIAILNSDFEYQSLPDKQFLKTTLGEAQLGKSLLELADSNLQLGAVNIADLDFNFTQIETDQAPGRSSIDTGALSLPYWRVNLAGLSISDGSFNFDLSSADKQAGFDPLNLLLTDFELELAESKYSPEAVSLQLEDLHTVIDESFVLSQLKLGLELNEEKLIVSKLNLLTDRSSLYSSLELSYSSIAEFIAHPEKFSHITLSLEPASILNLNELLYFQPALDSIAMVETLAAEPITLQGNIEGTLDNLDLNHLEIKTLSATRVQVHGNIKGLPNQDELQLDIPAFIVQTSSADLSHLVDTAGLRLPSELSLAGEVAGSTELLKTEFTLKTDLGNILAEVELRDLMSRPLYQGQFKFVDLRLSELAGIEDLNPVTSQLTFEGAGTTLSDLVLKLDLGFDSLVMNGFDYHALMLSAALDHQNIRINLNNENKELIITASLEGYLDTIASDLQLSVDLGGADLQLLGLTGRRLKTSFQLESKFKGSPTDFDFTTTMGKLLVIGNGQAYRADSVYLTLSTAPDSTSFDLATSIIRGNLQSNRSLNELALTIEYLTGLKDLSDFKIEEDFRLSASLEMNNSALLSDILLPDLRDMDTLRFAAEFRPDQKKLAANLSVPSLIYTDREIKNLQLKLNTDYDSTNIALNYDQLTGRWLNMGTTSLVLNRYLNNGTGQLRVLNAKDTVDYNLVASFKQTDQQFSLHLEEESLILNGEDWQIDPQNKFSWTEAGYAIKHFNMSYYDQQLSIASDTTGQDIEVLFNAFDLQVFFGLLNNGQDLLAGQLNGSFNALNVLETPGFVADLELNALELIGTEVGTMSLDAANTSAEDFDMELLLKGSEIDLKVAGTYCTAPQKEAISIEAKLDRLGLSLIQSLFPDIIDSSKGYLQADLSLKGKLKEPEYTGNIDFMAVGFELIQPGGYFSLDDAMISVSNSGLIFNRFEIQDEAGNKAAITGSIDTENPLNPAFDLALKAQNFQLLQVEQGVNDLYFGEVRADLDIRVAGDLDLPVIKSKVVLRDETDFTYIVPVSKAQLESRNGIVVFEDMQDTLKFMTIDKAEQQRTIRGFDLDSRIILKEGTRLRMILDPRSGDNLSITGAADLQYLLLPNGNMSLTGNYELSDGGYKLNLFELVKKEFDIRAGSKILWSGDPMGADLDITAVYQSRTSAASLMSDPNPRFNRVLPFQVLLFIKGTIDQPEISFAIDMPTDSRGVLAGDVYAKVREVNQNESELNKQVFGLIVFDRFIPNSESGDAGVSTADIALSSVSGFVSSQLNSLSEKYLQGVELDVNIGSYTDYGMGAGQQRTDLNVTMKKAFFDDRFVVEMGSNVAIQGYQPANQIVGDVAVEYKLTEDGRYRLRGYRRNDFENPVEGQVVITGLGLIFSREFNTWDELMAKPAEADTAKTETPAEVEE